MSAMKEDYAMNTELRGKRAAIALVLIGQPAGSGNRAARLAPSHILSQVMNRIVCLEDLGSMGNGLLIYVMA